MKNNQGFTLIQVMLVVILLSVIAGVGMTYINYNARRIAANERSDDANRLISNIQTTAAHEGSLKKTESLQFDSSLATPTP